MGGVGVLLLVTGGLWWTSTHAPLDAVAELAVRAGVRELHEPLRPLTPGPRVLLFALDGVGANELEAVVGDARDEPWRSLLGARVGKDRFEHAYSVPDVLSILPSTTVAAWTSVYTGEPPARTGVSGNEWFARARRGPRAASTHPPR